MLEAVQSLTYPIEAEMSKTDVMYFVNNNYRHLAQPAIPVLATAGYFAQT
jgi:hypothetical protein